MKKDIAPLDYSWNTILWILKFICAPIAVPVILFKLSRAIRPTINLQDKVVFITGASSGIGEALAHKFYSRGCRIILAARRIEELQRVKNDLLNIQTTIRTHVPVVMQLDLTDLNDLPGHVLKIIEMFGQVDILINNGGISHRGSASDTVLDVDIKIMTVNYFGQIALTKAVLPQMIKQKSGHIVFVNSMQGKIGLPRRSAYAASKHALLGFADSLRAEVHGDNVKVTTVCPSYVKTDLSLNAMTPSGEKYGIMDKTTNKGDSPETVAEEIVNAVLYSQNEITLGPFYRKLFIYGRNILSPVYFKILEKFEDDAKRSN